MKKIALYTTIVCLIIACSYSADKEVPRVIEDYENFIDSIISVERNYKNGIDTELIEVVIDPNDTSLKICCDTIVSFPSEESSIYSTENKISIYRIIDSFKVNIDFHRASLDKNLTSRYLSLNKRIDSLWEDHRKDSISFATFMDSINHK